MSTHAIIAQENLHGGYTGIYVHSSGYPEWTWPVLTEAYTDPVKIAELLRLGDLSHLGQQIGEKHPFDTAPRDAFYQARPEARDWCLAYGRDRGDCTTGSRQFKSLAGLGRTAHNYNAEYLYVYENGKWCAYGMSKAKPIWIAYDELDRRVAESKARFADVQQAPPVLVAAETRIEEPVENADVFYY